MNDKYISKMFENANTEIKDVPTLNILICYLLDKLGKPVISEQLYDILVGTSLVNYFSYQDSIAFLLDNGHIVAEIDDNGCQCYVLMPKGIECAKTLKKYAPKSYRDKLVITAVKYFSNLQMEKEIKINYSDADNGCYVQIRFLDIKNDLLDLKIFAPDMTQAKFLGDKIMLDPAGFYSKLIDLILSNEEIPYDLTDN